MDEILNLIESVSEGFPSYFFIKIQYTADNFYLMYIVFLSSIKCLYLVFLTPVHYIFIM